MIKLIQGDCLDVLRRLPHIDAVVTDPPYGIALADHDPAFSLRPRAPTIVGDDDQNVGVALLSWAESRGLPTVALASPYRPWPGRWRNLLVWDKGPAVGRGGDPATCWKRTWELICVARNKRLRLGRGQAVLGHHVRPDSFMNHPAEKPVSLMAYLIEQLTEPGDTIFDPFMGSGSTGIACVETGRNFIGVEIDSEHFSTAKSRIRAAQRERKRVSA